MVNRTKIVVTDADLGLGLGWVVDSYIDDIFS